MSYSLGRVSAHIAGAPQSLVLSLELNVVILGAIVFIVERTWFEAKSQRFMGAIGWRD